MTSASRPAQSLRMAAAGRSITSTLQRSTIWIGRPPRAASDSHIVMRLGGGPPDEPRWPTARWWRRPAISVRAMIAPLLISVAVDGQLRPGTQTSALPTVAAG
jgi:hypothetical protein